MQLDVLLQVDSTNRFLAAQAAPEIDHASVCVAEVQTMGKGRRGRTWVAPFGSGICLSLAFKFAESPPQLSALGLGVGVALLRRREDDSSARPLLRLEEPSLSLPRPDWSNLLLLLLMLMLL